MTLETPEVKKPTLTEFKALLDSHDFWDDSRPQNKQYSEDCESMTFDLPLDISLTLKRRGTVKARWRHDYAKETEEISDYMTQHDYSGYEISFKWNSDKITLVGRDPQDVVHRFALALAAITKPEPVGCNCE